MRRTKVLVAYYSLTGHSRALADEIAAELGASVHQIRCRSLEEGLMLSLKRIWSALTRTRPAITVEGDGDIGDFDFLVIGGPVWADRAATPLVSYLAKAGDQLPRTVAIFLSSSSSSGPDPASNLTDMLPKQPVAIVNVGDKERINGRHVAVVQDFLGAVQAEITSAHAGSSV